jgi:hypothetical protein
MLNVAIVECSDNKFADFWPVHALALGVGSSAAVPRPSGSSFMPLRCPHQAPELRIGISWSTTLNRPPWWLDQADGVLSAAA